MCNISVTRGIKIWFIIEKEFNIQSKSNLIEHKKILIYTDKYTHIESEKLN